MQKIAARSILGIVAILALHIAAQVESAHAAGENTAEVVEYLIGQVYDSDLTFIRNGEEHSGEEAAKHIRRKYKHFKSQIRTPEDFIRICASKSLVSGELYLVATPQGTVALQNWLGRILMEFRKRS